ncbi:hypothetical protein H6F43_02010 [Leptolyngbya sp. FACHB-36]|nr:hypothetical protein [Leptolyngbya sp. FACHB-36]MBD2018961.1 hypothetical protein [Leptolyngbya sp. FACHB-36]
MACAIMARDSRIGKDLLANLRKRSSPENVAGVMIVSLERLLWTDAEAMIWAIDHLLPIDVLQEIRRITSVAIGKRLIHKGLQPGEDFSVDSTGRLLLNSKAELAILGC